jgi:hypothetical protein
MNKAAQISALATLSLVNGFPGYTGVRNFKILLATSSSPLAPWPPCLPFAS